VEVDADINDPAFARAVADALARAFAATAASAALQGAEN